MKKKHIILVSFYRLIPAMLMLVTFSNSTWAQTLITPSNSPIGPASLAGLNQVDGVNSAMIECSNGPTQLIAIVYYDAATPTAELYIEDVSAGQSTLVTLGTTPNSTPDVIISNNVNGTVDDYIVTVVYTDGSTVYAEYFEVTADGSVTGYVGPTTSTKTATYTPPSAPSSVHIDGVADYTSTGFSGYPECRYAGIVWEESGGGIIAEYIDVSAMPTSFSPTLISATGIVPDIAVSLRDTAVGGTTIQATKAMITYTGNAVLSLRIREWDITYNVVSGEYVEGVVSVGHTITNPRIDAIDDNSINGAGTGNSYYKIVAQYNGTNNQIRTYDNTLGNSGWTSSSVINYGVSTPPPYDHFAPTVAVAGSNPDYMVVHFTDDGAGGDIVMMEPIDYTASTQLASPPNEYYWVSQSPATSANGIYASSVSSNCNNVTNNALVVWGLENNTTTYDVWYKITTFPYGFKQDPGNNSMVKSGQPFEPYPNPAKGYIRVDNRVGAGQYSITDMTGRAVLHGELPQGENTLDLGGIVPGVYIVKIIAPNGNIQTGMIVKE